MRLTTWKWPKGKTLYFYVLIMEFFWVFLVESQREKMNNVAETCLTGIGVGANYAICLVLLYHLYIHLYHLLFIYPFSETNPPIWLNVNIDYLNSSVHHGGNNEDFLKWKVVFRSFSCKIKWTWERFFPKFSNWPLTIRDKTVLLVYFTANFDKTF